MKQHNGFSTKLAIVDLKKLKYAVGHSKYSFHQVCKGAKLPRSAYRYWNGERTIPLEYAIRISYFIGVHINEFIDKDTLWLLRNTLK